MQSCCICRCLETNTVVLVCMCVHCVVRLLLLQGDEYFEKERERLERMISSGGVASNKVDDFARKSSVLSAFAAE